MSYVVVMPYIVESWAKACLETCKLDNVVLVDNTIRNKGIMRSHNLGIDHMRAIDAEWLVVLSAAVRFGEPGGLDFIEQLAEYPDFAVLSGEVVYGWHLIAFARATIEAAGRWDECFGMYGYDDVDYSIRIHKALPDAHWRRVPLDCTDAGMAHSIKIGGVKVHNAHALAHLRRKWGAEHGREFDVYYDHPYNDPRRPMGYWPEPDRKLYPILAGAKWNAPAPERDWADVTILRPT